MPDHKRIYWRGDYLASFMRVRGESNPSLAEKIRNRLPHRKCSPTLVSSWINIGREPRHYETLLVLADLLGVDVNEFFSHSPQHVPGQSREQ